MKLLVLAFDAQSGVIAGS